MKKSPNTVRDSRGLHTQSRKNANLHLQSSKLGLPHPPTRRRVCTSPPLVPVGHTRLRERGVGVPNSDEGTDTVVLGI
jgi:hypothetical protein